MHVAIEEISFSETIQKASKNVLLAMVEAERITKAPVPNKVNSTIHIEALAGAILFITISTALVFKKRKWTAKHPEVGKCYIFFITEYISDLRIDELRIKQ